MLRQVLVLQLSKLGVSADAAASGMEALSLYQDRRYRLIFMDIQMPGMDGLETTRTIRRRELELGIEPVPIIAVTGASDRKHCLEAGMTDFAQKPLMVEALQHLLARWFKPYKLAEN